MSYVYNKYKAISSLMSMEISLMILKELVIVALL